MTEEFAGGYPSDEAWHGYINNSDRVLLKVCVAISLTFPNQLPSNCMACG